jgi:hypothetical protein
LSKSDRYAPHPNVPEVIIEMPSLLPAMIDRVSLSPSHPTFLRDAPSNRAVGSCYRGTFCGSVSHCDPYKVPMALVEHPSEADCYPAKWLKSSRRRVVLGNCQ